MKKHTIFIFPVKQKGMWFKKVAVDGNTIPLVKTSEDEILKEILPTLFPQTTTLFAVDYIPAWVGKRYELKQMGFAIHEQYNHDEKNTIIVITEPAPQPTKVYLHFEQGTGYNMRAFVDGVRQKDLDGQGQVDGGVYRFLKGLGQLKDIYTHCRPTQYMRYLPAGWIIEHTHSEKWDSVVITMPTQP